MTATVYSSITKDIDGLIRRYGNQAEPDVVAYMVMRAAMLNVRGRRTDEDVSSLAYRLADEFATGGVPG